MFDRIDIDRPIDRVRRLADGSAYRIRPSGADDRGLLIRCFEALSPDSRRMRFFTHKQTLTPEDLDLFCGADGRDHLALAAVRIDALGRELEPLGFARCLRLSPGGEVAELSIVTADRVQGQGVGSALLACLGEAAWSAGIRRFRFEVLAENAGMRRLAQRLGGTAEWVGNGIVEYDCALPEPVCPAPTPLLPWYLNPGAWIEPWAETVIANLDHYIGWMQAANDELGARLEEAA